MPTFRYRAVAPGGELQQGEIDAPDRASVVDRLQATGGVPVVVELIGPEFDAPRFAGSRVRPARRRVGIEQGAMVMRQLAALLQAGLALDRALEMTAEAMESSLSRQVIERVLARVRGGASLSSALGASGSDFDAFVVSTVRAGEESGALAASLACIADHLEWRKGVRDAVASALLYPLVLVLVACLSVAILMLYVVPRFAEMFADLDQPLPLFSALVFRAAELIVSYWWVIALAVAGGGVALVRVVGNPRTRRRMDELALALPLIGALILKTEIAILARQVGVLLDSGVPVTSALAIAENAIGNTVIRDTVRAATIAVERGERLSRALAAGAVVPRRVIQLVEVGEQGSRLPEMLGQVATMYEAEARRTLTRLLGLLEPALIVGLGIVVGGIIVSVLLAILELNTLIT